MSPQSVSAFEVVALLRRAARGEVALVVVGESWDEVFAGNVRIRLCDDEVTIFNDCDDFDYVDSVRLADGRSADFDDWVALGPNPGDLLTGEEITALVARIRQK